MVGGPVEYVLNLHTNGEEMLGITLNQNTSRDLLLILARFVMRPVALAKAWKITKENINRIIIRYK